MPLVLVIALNASGKTQSTCESTCPSGTLLNKKISECGPCAAPCSGYQVWTAGCDGSVVDRVCERCDGVENYQPIPGQTFCKETTVCTAGQVVVKQPSESTDRTCAACDGVAGYQDEANQPSCKPVTPCEPGFDEVSQPRPSSNTRCEECMQDSRWTLIFRQKFDGDINDLYQPNQWSRNSEDPSADNYAILDKLETFRRLDGRFKFGLAYPQLCAATQCQERELISWFQVTNPVTMQPVVGFDAINLKYGLEGQNHTEFRGLENSKMSTDKNVSLLDGLVNHANWWFAIGSITPFATTKIPGPLDSNGVGITVNHVELYVDSADDFEHSVMSFDGYGDYLTLTDPIEGLPVGNSPYVCSMF